MPREQRHCNIVMPDDAKPEEDEDSTCIDSNNLDDSLGCVHDADECKENNNLFQKESANHLWSLAHHKVWQRTRVFAKTALHQFAVKAQQTFTKSHSAWQPQFTFCVLCAQSQKRERFQGQCHPLQAKQWKVFTKILASCPLFHHTQPMSMLHCLCKTLEQVWKDCVPHFDILGHRMPLGITMNGRNHSTLLAKLSNSLQKMWQSKIKLTQCQCPKQLISTQKQTVMVHCSKALLCNKTEHGQKGPVETHAPPQMDTSLKLAASQKLLLDASVAQGSAECVLCMTTCNVEPHLSTDVQKTAKTVQNQWNQQLLCCQQKTHLMQPPLPQKATSKPSQHNCCKFTALSATETVGGEAATISKSAACVASPSNRLVALQSGC